MECYICDKALMHIAYHRIVGAYTYLCTMFFGNDIDNSVGSVKVYILVRCTNAFMIYYRVGNLFKLHQLLIMYKPCN